MLKYIFIALHNLKWKNNDDFIIPDKSCAVITVFTISENEQKVTKTYLLGDKMAKKTKQTIERCMFVTKKKKAIFLILFLILLVLLFTAEIDKCKN